MQPISLFRTWSLISSFLSFSYLIECDLDILETQVVQSKHHHIDKCERSHTLGDVGIEFIRWDDAEKLVAKPGDAKVREPSSSHHIPGTYMTPTYVLPR